MAVLRYPYSAVTDKTDYLQLDIIQYKEVGGTLVAAPGNRTATLNRNVSGVLSGQLSKKSASINDSILLPMPSNIQDGNSVKYADDSLNGYVAQALQGVNVAMNIDVTNFQQSVTDATSKIGSIINPLIQDSRVRDTLMRALGAQAINIFGGNVTPDQILARQQGEIFNPNMELLFNGVTLRAFKFSFKMTPRNENEAKQIKLIIRSLKRNMAPKAFDTKFVKTPNVFELKYRRGPNDHPFLHKFKQCALTDMAVNYTGENVYATYGGTEAAPVSMIMDLTFRELEPIYESDYANTDGVDLDSTVGY